MPLTVVQIKSARPQSKTIRLFDGRGLYIEITPSGGRWRFKYRFAGKERRLSLGVFPEVNLQQAREKLSEVRKELASGIDPSAARKLAKLAVLQNAGNTVEVVGKEWFTKHQAN